MFALDYFYKRERVQRQMHDLICLIAKPSNLTVDQLNAIKGIIGQLKPKLEMSDEVDMEGAQAELATQHQETYQQRLNKIDQSIAMIERNLAGSSTDDQVQQFQLYGQGSSYDQPEQLTTDAESLDPLMVRQMMQERHVKHMKIVFYMH